MSTRRTSTICGTVVLGLSLVMVGIALGQSRPKLDIKDKVVLANVSRFPATLRIKKFRKQVAPQKASVLSPKRYPVVLEYWNGIKVGGKWVPISIPKAGIYLFRFQNGRWNLAKHQPRRTARRGPARTAYRPRTYRRTTGSRGRVYRGRARGPAFRGRQVRNGWRIPRLRNLAGDVLRLYRFVRDEEDRDLLRDMIIGKEVDREIEREVLDKLDKIAVTLPATEKLELDRAWRNLKNLGDKELQDLDRVTDAEWNQVRDSLGDQVTDNAWRDLKSDFADLDINDLSANEIADLNDVGIGSFDSDVDFADLGGGADLGFGDLSVSLDTMDVRAISGGLDDVGLGDLGGGADFGGGGFGGGGGYDSGGFNDFGGGFDDFGGGFDDFGGGFDDF